MTTHKVIQHHSLLAQGNMQLSVIHKQQVLTTPVSIYATQRDMQLALNALSKDFTVGFLSCVRSVYIVLFSLKNSGMCLSSWISSHFTPILLIYCACFMY